MNDREIQDFIDAQKEFNGIQYDINKTSIEAIKWTGIGLVITMVVSSIALVVATIALAK